MDTTMLPVQGNYTIGYLNLTSSVSACKRVGMFKFTALNTGLASTLTLNVQAETSDISFTLYGFSSGSQIGYNFTWTFNNQTSVDVSTANWQMTKGSQYYLTIQSWTSMKIPCGQDNNPEYGVITQQGPNNKPCGSSPWTTLAVADGGYIHMKIDGFLPSFSATSTWLRPSFAVSNSVSASSSASTSTSPSPSASSSLSVHTSQSSSVLETSYSRYTSRPTGFSPSVTPLTTNSIISSNGPLNTSYFASSNQVPMAPVIGGSISGVVLGGLVGFFMGRLIYRRFQISKARSPVSSVSIITLNPTRA